VPPAPAASDDPTPPLRPPDPTPEDPTPDTPTDHDPAPGGETVVILPAEDFRLPDILRYLEAGRTVLILPASPRAT